MDQHIPLSNGVNIVLRSNPDCKSLRIVIITGNDKKFKEFQSQLGDGYGMDVQQWMLDESRSIIPTLEMIMSIRHFSPHFIVREETTLVSRKDNTDLTRIPLADIALRKLESVVHTSTLNVYKPQWDNCKLTGFTFRQYEKRSYGYISQYVNTAVDGFGWDALFVNATTNLTNEQYYLQYGKKSARQHTISDFIETHLRYKALTTLKHHQLALTRPIDFGANYFHISKFVKDEKHLSNPFINDWKIENLRNAVINEGLFVKAAWSRPVKNYFSPPFSGLPLTAKKDAVEETIFMTHDMLHHLVCDLICDVIPTKNHFFIYCAWRMASEACTLVLADMLYADGLIKLGVDRSCVDKRIYPLFEAIADYAQSKIEFIKQLLFANVMYALLGDDSAWKSLLIKDDNLEAYKRHFGKFFIGDNAWTRANFDNMYKHENVLRGWIHNVGQCAFRASNIPLLSDVAKALEDLKVDCSIYENVVKGVFEIIFTTKLLPHLLEPSVKLEPDNIIQSRAFRRFIIGQASLFSRYPTPLNLDHIKYSILNCIQFDSFLSNEKQDEIRLLFEQYIMGIEGLRLMSRDEALNAVDCSAVFPAVYISYADMQKRYGTIENCVNECIKSYVY